MTTRYFPATTFAPPLQPPRAARHGHRPKLLRRPAQGKLWGSDDRGGGRHGERQPDIPQRALHLLPAARSCPTWLLPGAPPVAGAGKLWESDGRRGSPAPRGSGGRRGARGRHATRVQTRGCVERHARERPQARERHGAWELMGSRRKVDERIRRSGRHPSTDCGVRFF
jgi:hypothetical protein